MSNLITEKAYWKDPVQVFAGITWFIGGGLLGFILDHIL